MRKLLVAIIAITALGVAEPTAPASHASSTGMMYWLGNTAGAIMRADRTGAKLEEVVTGLTAPRGPVLDVIGGKMYWSDSGTGKIQRANLDGTGVEDLVVGLSQPLEVAIDAIGSKMYWTDAGTGKIQRANLDGSAVEDLVAGLVTPGRIALDAGGGKMYWTDTGTRTIQRASLSGADVEELVSLGSCFQTCPVLFTLDLSGGRMYWARLLGPIESANLDGSGLEGVASVWYPMDLEVDPAGGKVYWSEVIQTSPTVLESTIKRKDLAGGAYEVILSSGCFCAWTFALDPGEGRMYWTDAVRGAIRGAGLDGSGAQDLVTGIDDPGGIVLDIGTEDYDRDGCSDARELGSDPYQGGMRDPVSFWDFYDVPTGGSLSRDGAVSGMDFFAVLARFNATDEGPGDFDRNSDPLSTPNQAVAGEDRANYHPAYDRSSPGPGEDLWDAGPPDGSVSGVDFFAVLAQFNHSCQ